MICLTLSGVDVFLAAQRQQPTLTPLSLIIYLAGLDLGCGIQDLSVAAFGSLELWCEGLSLVVCGLTSCGSWA